MSKRKDFTGNIVYSTNPDFRFENDEDEEPQTLPAEKQRLHVMLERKGRGGKQVTLVDGFVGSEDDLDALCKKLKTKCGTGGSAKDGVIIIQGDCRTKVVETLSADGYKVKGG